ncbi:type VII secretion protein EccCa [Streptomyces sp. NPDC048290]|uniref:type VII secretion protein EccCa n=1 Tax=Streptomyces sp. NPDC048290 TaxID=3155811 RepID=UPI00344929D4
MPSGELQLQEPPTLPETQSGMSHVISYLPMALSSMAMMMMFLPMNANSGMLSWIAMGMMALGAIGMLVAQFFRTLSERKQTLRGERRDYFRYLNQMRRSVRKTIRAQQDALAWRHPETDALRDVVRTSRLWERRVNHPDFADVRMASGPQRLAMQLAPLQTKPVEDLEPLCAHALRRFIHAYSTVPDQPIAASLRGYAQILLRVVAEDEDPAPDDDTAEGAEGTSAAQEETRAAAQEEAAEQARAAAREQGRALVRSMLLQLAVFHAPDELRIVVVCDQDGAEHWQWLKWLPHALHPRRTDGAGPVRLLAHTVAEAEQLLGDEFSGRSAFEPDAPPTRDEPFTVLVLDGPGFAPASRPAIAGYRNAVIMDIGDALDWKPDRRVLRLRINAGALEMIGTDRNGKLTAKPLGVPDATDPHTATSLAAQLAPFRLGDSTDSTEPLDTDIELTSLLGIRDLHEFEPKRLWETRTPADRLRVPIGKAADGTPTALDIKESAQGGMGPHGMLIGATGSGKSELLRTLVLGLALTHSSETLNFVLVDFKGGATFLGLDRLPHTSAVITNLEDEAALVDRMRDALHGELVRRQELLRKAGNYASLLEYETARAGGAGLAPLPTLFVIVDEFSELLAQHRDFMDLFVMIGRLGRSLGVHLLLASQRLDEGRIHALESHLSYRMALRTFSAMESRAVLGVTDAYELPPQPGNGFLRSDISTLTRFKAAYVSGTYRHRHREARLALAAGQVVPYGTAEVAVRELPPEETPGEPEAGAADTRSLLEVAAERLTDTGPPAHRVWLPPLDVPPTLDELLPPLSPHPEYGMTVDDPALRGKLKVPVGYVDRPFHQRREVLYADVSAGGGHVAIAGGPQSGKSTLLRTLITALALTHTPREVQFLCLDFGGGTLTSLRGLPHLSGVTGRHDAERLMRTISEVQTILSEREVRFAQEGVDSIASYRKRRAAGEFADDPHASDVFLVVDGWNTLRQEYMDLVATLVLIAGRGLNYGVHLVVAATRWSEMGSALRDQLGTRFELRLGDPVDSVIHMKAAESVPKIPGRGLTADRLHYLVALPRMDGLGTTADLGDGVTDLVDAVAEHWTGPRVPEVRMLPVLLPAADLPAPTGRLKVALGLEDQHIGPMWHDFEDSAHLLVVGDTECGKTNLLRHLTENIQRAYTPDEARILLVDPRRGLYEAVPKEQQLGYAVSIDTVTELLKGAARAMQTRRPPADTSPAQLKRRDWWTGPELFVIVDDYDMLGGLNPVKHPFEPLLQYLSQGVELGLHVIVARGANGASRGMSDALLRKLMEVNTPALLMSCPKEESYIFGSVKPKQYPAGRGQYITRRSVVQVQTGLLPDEGDPADDTEGEGS